MKICPECNQESEDEYNICWNCSYSFDEKRIIGFASDPKPETRKLSCLRCNVDMNYEGLYKLHEGTRYGIFGDLFEAFENRLNLDIYRCPQCGKIEFFTPPA